MTPSSAALQLARQSEGLRLTAYRDETGRLTIGYGHAEGVQAGQTITEEEAEQLLVDDMDEAGAEVSRLVTVPLAQGQFDALVSSSLQEVTDLWDWAALDLDTKSGPMVQIRANPFAAG